jgi:hypothetical protein
MSLKREDRQFESAYVKLINSLERMRRQIGDVERYPIDSEGERLDYLLNQVMDSAHEILDLAHEFKTAVRSKSDSE